MRSRLEEPRAHAVLASLYTSIEQAQETFLRHVLGDVSVTGEAMAVADEVRVLLVEGRIEVHGVSWRRLCSSTS